MNEICRDIFRAVHEGKWLKIEYLNRNNETTHYWIGIKQIDVNNGKLIVDGLDVAHYQIRELIVNIQSIKKSSVLDNTFFPVNDNLIEDIDLNPQKYSELFHNLFNLKVLTYYEKCNQMDCVPYTSEYTTIDFIDEQILSEAGDSYHLSEEQYQDLVKSFNIKIISNNKELKRISKKIGLNILSVNTSRGLYVLAFKELRLDVLHKCLRPSDNITVCYEYTVDGKAVSAHRFLDADDYELMEDFENHRELIKDKIMNNLVRGQSVDDMPHIVELQYESILDLHSQYDGIIKMVEKDNVSMPIKAFWGELISKPKRRSQNFPMAFVNRNTQTF